MYTTVGKSGFITAMYILIVPILGLLLGQKVGRSVWLGVVLSLVGLYFLCLSGGVGGVNLGDLLTLACALFFAMHIQYVARVGGETECVRMSCVQFLVNALLSAVGMALFESPSWSAVASCWLPILHAGVLSGGVAFTLQIVGQQYTSPTLASMLLSLESVFAAIFGAILIPSQALQGREGHGKSCRNGAEYPSVRLKTRHVTFGCANVKPRCWRGKSLFATISPPKHRRSHDEIIR